MKIYIYLIITLFPFLVNGQIVKYNISGKVNATENGKFAYLAKPKHNNFFYKVPIEDGKFSFKGNINYDGEWFKWAMVFIDKRSNITEEELISRLLNHTWVNGRDNFRAIIVENLELSINSEDENYMSKIISGGVLTKQYDMYHGAIRSDRVKFVKENPDSPFSYQLIEKSIEYANPNNILETKQMVNKMFFLLSARIRTSAKGIALKKQINEL